MHALHMVLITDLVKTSKTIDVFYNVCLFSIISLLNVWRIFSVLYIVFSICHTLNSAKLPLEQYIEGENNNCNITSMRIQSEAPENKAIPKFSTLKLITVPSLFDYLILFSTSSKQLDACHHLAMLFLKLLKCFQANSLTFKTYIQQKFCFPCHPTIFLWCDLATPNSSYYHAGWQKLAAFWPAQNGHKKIRQARICYFRDKCVVTSLMGGPN